MAVRFHLDEHVDHEIAVALRTRGIDVTMGQRRVIFTNDQDDLRLHSQGIAHAGIVYCARGSRSAKEIIRYLCLIHDCLTEEEMSGRIEYL